jgi:phosphatidylserine/phosphatidylglycerophosphate/cardiolipin synthase-like enzyme
VITARTLTDGGQQPVEIAQLIAGYLGAATKTLDIALYDLMLGPETEPIVIGALGDAKNRGVAVRLAYNLDHRNPIPVPPPPQAVPEDIEKIDVPTKGIAGIPDLMHHKFIVRDGASVVTGSTNWTDDSWSREENVVLTVDSPELARAYTIGFEELWTTGDVARSGQVEPPRGRVNGDEVRPWFCPGEGEALSHRIAKAIGRAKRRIRICSPVISSAPILGTLAQVVSDGKVDLAGAIDVTQIEEVLYQWAHNGVSGWKVPMLRHVLLDGRFSGKTSIKWAPGTVHDYMHAKVTVADDVIFCGSFNLSHSGERNAEDMLEIEDPKLADQLGTFVDGVVARYPAVTLT